MAVLRGTAPPWAALLREENAAAEFLAAPLLPSGDAVPAAIVRVSGTGGWLSVAEREPGRLFPERCPELHVNDNSTFCMARRGYRCVEGPNSKSLPRKLTPGTKLVRDWHGLGHTVTVLVDGFEYDGKHWKTLSAVAKTITGAHWNGPLFFGLSERKQS